MLVSAKPILIGIDGGGSRCRVAISQHDGPVLGTAEGPAANAVTSTKGAIQSLLDVLGAACAEAGLQVEDTHTAFAHVGLAGVINEEIAAKIAQTLPMKHIHVSNDRPTNMAGALGAADGFVAAIGTGSFVGRQSAKECQFVGGWGLILGDQASGAWLGRQLLSRVLEWKDGLQEPSPVLSETFAEFGDDTGAVVLFAKDANPSDFARFAPQVVSAAGSGDAVALGMLNDGARYIDNALTKLGYVNGLPLCFLGGLGPQYRPHLAPEFTKNIVTPQGSALDGALTLAARMAENVAWETL